MKARSREEESEMNNAFSQKTLLPGRQARCTTGWTTTGTCLPPSRHLSFRCGHSRRYSGTPRCTSSTSCRTCRFSVCLCRRWRLRWWSCCRRSTRRRAGYCCAHDLSEQLVEVKCGLCCLKPCFSSGLRSKTLTFQFLIVVVVREVFKVFPQDRVQQHGLWSRTLIFPFPEVACMLSLILVVPAHPQFRVMSVEKGFSSDFSPS